MPSKFPRHGINGDMSDKSSGNPDGNPDGGIF